MNEQPTTDNQQPTTNPATSAGQTHQPPTISNEKKTPSVRAAATGMLVVMTFIFILSNHFEPQYAWLGYVRAFAEAAMIGGLADWFAVVALFRHPLGLPIPHTNIVEMRKKDIAAGISTFVVKNFLNDASILKQLENIRFGTSLAAGIRREDNPQRIARRLVGYVPAALDSLDEPQLNEFLITNIRSIINKIDSAEILSKMLNYLVEKDMHQRLLADVLDLVDKTATEEVLEVRIYEEVKKRREWYWPPSLLITERVVRIIREYLTAMKNDPAHEVRHKVNEFIERFITSLNQSDEYKSAAEAIKQNLLDSSTIQQYSSTIWQDVKAALVRDAEQGEQSRVAGVMQKVLLKVSDEIDRDEKLQLLIDETLKKEALNALRNMRQDIADHISKTILEWTDIADRIENELGADLQYIRINGTLVGGFIGLLLYILFDKVFV